MAAADETSMLAFLEQLRSRVADAEQQQQQQQTQADVSESEEDEEEQGHAAALKQAHRPPLQLQVAERSVTYTNGDTYTGAMLGDQRHGRGTHITSTGDAYSGDWLYDRRHGRGVFKAASGVVYDGAWVDDMACGHGKCSYPDGGVYEGDWEADARCGWGLLRMPDGQVFEGEWDHNQPHGEGQWVLADGLSHYRGSFAAGKRVRGQLVLFYAASKKPLHTYSGSFKDEKRHGQDCVGVEEGLWTYRGEWREDMRWGEGHCRWHTDGSVYEGGWRQDCRHGSGRLTLPDGTRYEGEWRQDRRHGSGRLTLPDGTRYEGGWVEGRRQGQGVMKYADGGRYKGGFQADKRHGHGLMLFPDGTVFRGAWEEDEWVQSAAEPALCRLGGAGLTTATAGVSARFTIQARDELDNARLSGGDVFSVLLVPAAEHMLPTGPAAAVEVAAPSLLLPAAANSSSSSPAVITAVAVGEVQDNGDGTYACSYTCDKAGRYMLHVTNGEGEHVADSPYRVHLLPGPASPQHSTVSGPGRRAALAGGVAHFDVAVRDAHGNCCLGSSTESCSSSSSSGGSSNGGGSSSADKQQQAQFDILLPECRLLGSNTLEAAPVEVSTLQPGLFRCSYTAPLAPGLYVLEVTSQQGRHVGGSPFSVEVSAPAPSQTCADITPTTAAAAPPLAACHHGASCSCGSCRGGISDHSSSSSSSSSGSNSSVNASSGANSERPAGPAAAAGAAAGPRPQQPGLDRLAWWAEVARQAYAAIDGCLDGFEDEAPQLPGSQLGDGAGLAGLSDAEAELVKANPALPVVEKLEDLWLLSKLQQERKAREQQGLRQQGQKQQQQQHQKGRVATPGEGAGGPGAELQECNPPAAADEAASGCLYDLD